MKHFTKLTATAGLAAALLFTAQLGAQDTVRLEGHVLDALPMAVHMTRSAQNAREPITLTVMLNWSDPDGFQAFIQGLKTPSSPLFRKYLKADEMKARFGPSQDAYDKVLAWLQQNGFLLVEGSDNRLTITVSGTRAQAEHAFDVTIDDYLMGSRQFHATDRNPSLPAALAPLVRSVSGLSNLAVPQPSLNPQAISQAYNGVLTPAGTLPGTGPGVLPPGLNGAGQTIALIEFDSFNPFDVAFWLNQVGLPASLINQVTTVQELGGTGPSGCQITQSTCGETEVLLDIGGVLAVAPGANIAVLVAPNKDENQLKMINAAVNYLNKGVGGGGTISNSWLVCEPEISGSDSDSMEGLIQAMEGYGMAFFAAAGDNGSTCVSPQGSWSNAVAYPANAPDAVGVGGTVLQPGSPETWWTGGGFGVSQHFGRPSWQTDLTLASGRSVPDVAAFAAPGIPVCINRQCSTIGGTSLATPIWAASWRSHRKPSNWRRA